MYRRREQECVAQYASAPLEPARSVLAPIALMMRLKEGRRKPPRCMFAKHVAMRRKETERRE